ncbi:MAG: T9SS type A sorting domain-containing protein, partial [Bacteroidales bacterium]|nr:T9SS type A sorting domain-containing protein [Bacteroidales bacterium]
TNISSNYFSNNKINIQAHAGFDNTRLMISNNEFMHMGQATQSLHFLNINNITIFDNDFTVNDDANGNPDVKGIYLSYTHPNLNECAEIIKNRIKVCSPIVVNGFNKNTKIRCNEISSLEITEGRYGYTADQYGLGDQGAPNSPAGNSSMYIYNNSNLFTYYASYDDSVYGWNIDVIRSPGTPNCSTGCTAPYSLVESRFSSLLEQTDNSQGADQFTSLDSIEPDTQTLMKITPNPNNGKIRLVLGSDINKTDVSREISIYNLSGALIHTEKLQDKETEIEMARLFSAGTYICTLKVDGKVIGKATAIVK